MKFYLCFAVLSALCFSQMRYSDGIRKKSGSNQCPQGYKKIMDKAECLKVAKGACLSDRQDECKLWSTWSAKKNFAANFGDGNQLGCYYDTKDGVIFNTRTSWSGKFNEVDDRPVCKMDSDYFSKYLYKEGIRKKDGSNQCPPDYKPIDDKAECLKVAKGPCLSQVSAECKLWSSWSAKNNFAADHGETNQPGCYYDQNDGVVFNTRTKWGGSLNEGDDRPICKYSRPLTEFEFVKSGTCESHGFHSIYNQKQCKDAGAAFAKSAEISSKLNWYFRKGEWNAGRPTGCSWHDRAKNLELWEFSSGSCNVNGYAGCFCIKDDFYSDGVRKVSGSDTCPDYYTQITDAKECKQVAQGQCLSDREDECELWSKWVLTDHFAKSHGTDNQPGCYYDEDHGVFFNTDSNFSGKFNENNDRPICKKDSETFGESKIVRMLRELIVEARKEITDVTSAVATAKSKKENAESVLTTAKVAEGVAKKVMDDASKALSAARGVLSTAQNEHDDNVPRLKDEIALFEKVIRMLQGLPANLVEEKEVNVTAFISLADQADPAKVKKVVGLLLNLIDAANAEIAALEKAVKEAQVNFNNKQSALAKATGAWKAAVSSRKKKQQLFTTAETAFNAAKNHADKRVPALNDEIATINNAIDLIKSLEE